MVLCYIRLIEVPLFFFFKREAIPGGTRENNIKTLCLPLGVALIGYRGKMSGCVKVQVLVG